MGRTPEGAAGCASYADRFDVFLVFFGMVFAPAAHAAEAQKPLPLKSGVEFASADVRKLQGDEFANPGMLWVVRGEKLWSEPAGTRGQTCTA